MNELIKKQEVQHLHIWENNKKIRENAHKCNVNKNGYFTAMAP